MLCTIEERLVDLTMHSNGIANLICEITIL